MPDARVAILLSTYNGERFLREQLDSLLTQSHPHWTLYWRDDSSSDGTVAILEEFARCAGQGRCVHVQGPPERLGPTVSFLTLLAAVKDSLGNEDVVAFADQDDVWLPEKLARGVAALRGANTDGPVIYCARQVLVDDGLRRIGLSRGLEKPAAFPAALAQNVITGCTIMMDRRAAALVAGSIPASATLHDWWCYLVVTAADGLLLHDDEPVVLYRQHNHNVVGAPRSMARRAVGAVRRGPNVFMNVLRQHVAALQAQPHLMSPKARAQVAAIDRALKGGPIRRLAALRMPGLHRQTWQENVGFWAWFLIG
ncbi:glycosyltransferase family 2 protein [Limobrevibacterium gyesilva]|uniref:Glycosyltransferase family 2 protein n=1 Tax=Limobrevibacterium gyesilva TaxID=2991712 RepID=A0AA41YN32_9PROT|nr:glycosyltransferase family 2 protein [Limobrevibacterium gyesilva]